MKKILAIVVSLMFAVASLVALAGCQNADFVVGVCQLAPHAALDNATQGFVDALTEEMQKAGKSVKIDVQNAQGDSPVCNTIINKFVSQRVDLIMANATAALQAAASATLDIPVLGTSVTNYGTALGLDNFNGTVGGNISGTSDLAPLDKQAEMIVELVPTAKKVGLLYCSSEPNSKYQVDIVKAKLTQSGLIAKEFPFLDSNEIQAVVTGAASECDVLYVPTDNTAATNGQIIYGVCSEKIIPVICGEENTCKLCGVATLSIDYYRLGRQTGLMAAKILLGNADISQMPVEFDTQPVYKYNKSVCDELGITVPSNYVQIPQD